MKHLWGWMAASVAFSQSPLLAQGATPIPAEQRVTVATSQGRQMLKGWRNSPQVVAKFTSACGVDPAEVYRTLDGTATAVSYWLSGDERLAPMVFYVEERFPTNPALAMVAMKGGGSCALPSSVDSALQVADAFLAELDPPGRALFVDIEFISEPPGAEVELNAGVNLHRATNTNNTMYNLSRGLYRFVIRQQGQQPVTGELDLIAESGTRLACRLVAAADSTRKSSCALKVPSTPDSTR